jgi:hypothetical protein
MQNVASEFRAVGIEPPDEIVADAAERVSVCTAVTNQATGLSVMCR